ncbi:MAG: carboxypeptidase regulatory-like domain-containing protein [Bacteroidetes bacterium]|nr:carboxypeptidase regulatory-like domain-containing protein [Bacteroidota bacterium]
MKQSLFYLIFTFFIPLYVYAGPDSIIVNGKRNGAVVLQGQMLEWKIYLSTPGETVENEVWIDINTNGVVDQGVDIRWARFTETDGITSSSGPGDFDGIANGIITTGFKIGLAPTSYIFISSGSGKTVTATFSFVEVQTYTFTIRGTVRYWNGKPAPNVLVVADAKDDNAVDVFHWSALTDNSGNYTIRLHEPLGTIWHIEPQAWNGSFMPQPKRFEVVGTSSNENINFVLVAPKLIIGTVKNSTGEPLSNVRVEAKQPYQAPIEETYTDRNGKYELCVQEGKYFVTFKKEGYVITTYNQKYVEWRGDTVVVTQAVDTIKNIDAILIRGGVITGSIRGGTCEGISAFIGSPSGQPFAWIYPSTQTSYIFMVPPGTYYILFWDNETQSGIWYNQVKDGTVAAFPHPITVGDYPDTVRNINVDFSITAIEDRGRTPQDFILFQNYPNPFNPSTVIEFILPVSSHATVTITNVLGQKVETLYNGIVIGGNRYRISFDGETYPSGVYFAKLEYRGNVFVRKLLLIK